MVSEITEDDPNPSSIQEKEAEKTRIRQIIAHQKSLYYSSSSSASNSSFSSLAASTSSSKSSSLLDLMREGSAPLRRLFEMEHTSLEKYFKEYSGSPLVRPILLWGSDTDEDNVRGDPWAGFRQTRSRLGDKEWRLSSRGSYSNGEVQHVKKMGKRGRRKLYRTKSYKRLPRFCLWRLRLIRKLRVLIRGRIF